MSKSKALTKVTKNFLVERNIFDETIDLTNPDALNDKILSLSQNVPPEILQDPKKILMVSDKINELNKYINKIQKLDLDLISLLKEDLSKRPNDTMSGNDFINGMSNIEEDSLIIFLENAELYKIYRSDELSSDFTNHLNTVFKRKDKIYEAVRDSNPQKLIIVIADDVQNRLLLIKSYIMEFITQRDKLNEIKNDDIVVYKNNTKTEFIAINVILQNVNEKDEFMEDFQRFMRSKGENDIANKIQVRQPASDVKGIRYYDLPRDKIPISADANTLNHYINKTQTIQNSPMIMNVTVNNILNSNNL